MKCWELRMLSATSGHEVSNEMDEKLLNAEPANSGRKGRGESPRFARHGRPGAAVPAWPEALVTVLLKAGS